MTTNNDIDDTWRHVTTQTTRRTTQRHVMTFNDIATFNDTQRRNIELHTKQWQITTTYNDTIDTIDTNPPEHQVVTFKVLWVLWGLVGVLCVIICCLCRYFTCRYVSLFRFVSSNVVSFFYVVCVAVCRRLLVTIDVMTQRQRQITTCETKSDI